MKQNKGLFFVFLTITLGRPAIGESAEYLSLALGEQAQITIAAGTRYSVGNPQVLGVKSTQVEPGKNALLLRAKAKGYSDLLLLFADGKSERLTYRVVAKGEGAVLKDVQSSLAKSKDLRLLPQGDKWIALGQLRSVEDYNLLQSYIANSNGKILDRSSLEPMTRMAVEEKIRQALLRAGLSHFSVRGLGSQIWLEGSAASKDEKEKAETLAREIFFSTKSGVRASFEVKDILRFKVQILEMIKTQHGNMGLEWGEQVPSFIQMQQKLLRAQFSLDAALNLMEQKGLVKVLSKPEIALNSEGIAELKVGGEIPISMHSLHFAGVQWKSYGLSLRLETPGIARDLARTNVTVEISTLDHANAVDGIPATKDNKMQTTVDLSLGKTIFLSGLMQNASAEDTKSVPGLGSIPLLGELFRSKDFRENRSELVMAITAKREEQNVRN